jgi:hypothetical protein
MDRTEIQHKDGIEYIYHYRQYLLDRKRFLDTDHPKHPPESYIATYNCGLCDNTWASVSETRPFATQMCIMPNCGNPSILQTIYRQLRKKPIWGVGKLVKVEVFTWDIVYHD